MRPVARPDPSCRPQDSSSARARISTFCFLHFPHLGDPARGLSRVRAKVGFLKKQGLHSIHTEMGNMRDDVLVLKVGTNAWFLEALSPLD